VQTVSDSPTVALVFVAEFMFCSLCISLFLIVFVGFCVASVVAAECILCSDCWCYFLCADFVFDFVVFCVILFFVFFL